MKAVYLKEPGKVSIREFEQTGRGNGEVLVKVKSASICGADVNSYLGKNNLVSYPRVIGHEVSGIVQEVGEDTDLKVGDSVVLEPYIYCGKCYPCSQDRTNCCINIEVLGVHRDGGMAEYISHPSHLVHKISPETPVEKASLVEPLSIALHTIHRLKLKKDEHIAIYGAGTIGLLCALVAIHYGATPILIDMLEERLRIAQDLGVEHVVNLSSQNTLEEIAKITDGVMAPCVVEASGAKGAIQESIEAAAFSGRIALTGYPKEPYIFNTSRVTVKELDVLGARNSAGEFPEAITLVEEGSIDVGSLISKTVLFEDLPEALIEQSEHPEKFLKIVGLF